MVNVEYVITHVEAIMSLIDNHNKIFEGRIGNTSDFEVVMHVLGFKKTVKK